MDRLKTYKCIDVCDVYKAFYNIIDDAGNWYFDDDVPKEAVTHYIDGVTEMTKRMLELFEEEDTPKGIVFPERDTICDKCPNLSLCEEEGDMIDVRLPGNKFPHYRPTSMWKCPLGKMKINCVILPENDGDEEEDDGDDETGV